MELVTGLYLLTLVLGTVYLYSRVLAGKDKGYRDESTIHSLTVKLNDCNDRNRVLSKKRVPASPLPCRDALTNKLIEMIHQEDDVTIIVAGMEVDYCVLEKTFYIEELRLSLYNHITKTSYHPNRLTLSSVNGNKLEMTYGRVFCEYVSEIILIRLGG